MARKNKKANKYEPRKGLGQKERTFLHLKEFSQGKPNELSFNVLEQKAANLDEQPKGLRFWRRRKKETEEASPLPVPLNPLNEEDSAPKEKVSNAAQKNKAKTPPPSGKKAKAQPSRTPFLGADSQAEIAARQKRRKRYRRLSLVAVIVICVAFLGTGGYWYYQEQQRLSTSVGVLHEACDLIESSDETTVAIDTYFQTTFNDDTVTNATNLKDSIPDARDKLESARVYASKAENEREGSQRDKEAAEHALSTIASRETMLESAESRLTDDIAAKQAIDLMVQAQSAIEEGNALLAQSAQVVSNTTEENVGKSTEYTTSANAQFEEARSLIEQAQAQYPSADYETLYEYVDKKREAASEALLSNAAILIQDKATAESHNDAYNAADTAATTLAENLPSDLTQLIVDAYATSQDSLTQTYEKSRADAATHDAFLREYLGTNT